MKYTLRILIFAVIFILIGRLFQLQILSTGYYKGLSERDRIRREIIPAPRGRILSREGKILAESRPSFSLMIDPYRVDSTGIFRLSKILGIKEEVIFKKVKPHFRTCRIRRVPFDVVSKIVEKQEKFPYIRLITEPVRYYPCGPIFSHLVGYTGEITSKELKEFKGSYRGGDIVGKKGVELKYDKFLQGKKGVSLVEVDVRGRVVRRFNRPAGKSPKTGLDLHLTVSEDLSLYADSLFSDFQSGACVGMDPKNGEILLYYSKPGYSSNKLAAGISTSEWANLRNREDAPLWDRIICGEYPPGSIGKIPTAIIGMENRVVDEFTTLIPCKGALLIGNRYFHCWKEHDKLALPDAIIQSCNIYFYQVGMKMSLEEMVEGEKKLGFGKRSGIDLPGEREGFIPTREWYNKKYGRRGWDRGILANLAIGQGELLLTPLQIVTFFSHVANGGTTYIPHILKDIRDNEGKIVWKPQLKRTRLPFSPKTLNIILEAMKAVVNSQKGTAYFSRLKGIEVGGKTGTSQNPRGKDHSLFVGFAPFTDPKIVVFTIIENAGHGSSYAAPMTAKIIKRYLSN
ncbi:MAG: penicillin-binding protein 2 [candidate division WOR-3 bacterium]|nr:penicillin-binding protein 2 [candidate division WOR-3 bacterium]